MKRLKIIGLALIALFAFAAFTASAAMALEEGVLEHETFTAAAENGVKPALETEKEKIQCATVSILEVAFQNDHHGSGVLHFTGCKAEGLLELLTLGDEKEVILTQILFLICLINSSTLLFGIWIQPTATVHIEIPFGKQLVLVKGAVIGHILSGNGPATLFLVDFTGSKGKQTSALKCTDNSGVEQKYTFEAANDSEAKDKPASENATVDITFKNKVSLTD